MVGEPPRGTCDARQRRRNAVAGGVERGLNATKRAETDGKPAPTATELGFGQPDHVAPIVVYLCSDAAAHLRSQFVTFNGSKLALWQHPRENVLRRQSSWTVDELAAALHDANEPVHVIEY